MMISLPPLEKGALSFFTAGLLHGSMQILLLPTGLHSIAIEMQKTSFSPQIFMTPHQAVFSEKYHEK